MDFNIKIFNELIFVIFFTISCSQKNNVTSNIYTPINTNCKKETNITFFDRVFYMITGSNNDEYDKYEDNLEYINCIKNEKIKDEYKEKIKDENYKIDYYDKGEVEKINDLNINKLIKNKELEELKRKNNVIKDLSNKSIIYE